MLEFFNANGGKGGTLADKVTKLFGAASTLSSGSDAVTEKLLKNAHHSINKANKFRKIKRFVSKTGKELNIFLLINHDKCC
ncbi:hypothetical protein [Thalassomonas viridans]|uniref:hypothetical protein n=1 Tax=Thalassomonas viridans TaxID=137584 RepID=UPI001F3B48AD|nr:hypothetical protein [Thalassomonas viridans]